MVFGRLTFWDLTTTFFSSPIGREEPGLVSAL